MLFVKIIQKIEDLYNNKYNKFVMFVIKIKSFNYFKKNIRINNNNKTKKFNNYQKFNKKFKNLLLMHLYNLMNCKKL